MNTEYMYGQTPSETPVNTSVIERQSFLSQHRTFIGVFIISLLLVGIAGVLTTVQLAQQTNQDVRSQAAADAQVNFTFGNLTQNGQVHGELINTVKVETNSRLLSAADITLKYDPQYIQVVSLTPTDKLSIVLAAAAIDNTAGVAKITVGAAGAATAAFNGTGDIVTIKYKALKATAPSTALRYDLAALQAAVIGQDGNAAKVTGESIITIGGSGEPTATTPSLDATFKVQGVRKAGVTQNATVIIKYTPTTETSPTTLSFTKAYTSNAEGMHSSASPLTITGLIIGQPLENVEVYVKTPVSLMKKIGTITLKPGETVQLVSTVQLPVGDFKNDGADGNVIKLNDIALAITEFKQLENPVTEQNKVYDVNFSGVYDLQDLAIVLTNFEQLEYPGEQP